MKPDSRYDIDAKSLLDWLCSQIDRERGMLDECRGKAWRDSESLHAMAIRSYKNVIDYIYETVDNQ